MFILDRMTTARFLEKALDAESLRRRIISNNIANVDVPHYKRTELNFESELGRIIRDNDAQENNLPFLAHDPRHLPVYSARDPFSVRPRMRLDYDTVGRNDGNNVDIEKEMVDASKNLMRYNAYTQMISGSYNKMKSVMRVVA